MRRDMTRPGPVRSPTWLPLCSLLALVVAAPSCATIGTKAGKTSERVIGSHKEREVDEKPTTLFSQDGTKVHIRVERKCELRNYDKVETTTRYESYNETPGRDWAYGLTGAAFVGLGAGLYADSSKVYPNDTTSRTYNPVGPDAEKGIAIVSLLIGGAMLAAAAVDIARAQETKEDSPSTRNRSGGSGGTCPAVPVAGAQVVGRLEKAGAGPLILGNTNAEGVLDIDLTSLQPVAPSGEPDGEPYGAQLVLFLNEEVVGQIPIAAAYPTWRTSWAEKRSAEAVQKTTAALESLEQTIAVAEGNLAALERANGPWGETEVAHVRSLINAVSVIQESSQLAMNTYNSESAHIREEAATALVPRVKAATRRVKLVLDRSQALIPRTSREVQAYKRRRDAEAVAVMQALLSQRARSSSAETESSAASRAMEAKLKEVEAQHQRERAEDQRRQQAERDSSERKCRSSCDEEMRTCRKTCNQTAERCRQNCPQDAIPGSITNLCKMRCDQDEQTCLQVTCPERERTCQSRCK